MHFYFNILAIKSKESLFQVAMKQKEPQTEALNNDQVYNYHCFSCNLFYFSPKNQLCYSKFSKIAVTR